MITLILAAVIAAPIPCPVPRTLDGDTIACGAIHIRLSGIDAPELPGHCRKGRICAPGDPVKSRDAMIATLASAPVTYRPIKLDLYKRTIALVYAGVVNVSCAQIASGSAIFKPTWDTRHYIKRECRL